MRTSQNRDAKKRKASPAGFPVLTGDRQPKFSLTAGGKTCNLQLTARAAHGPNAECDGHTVTVRMERTADHLLHNLNLGAGLVSGLADADRRRRDSGSLRDFLDRLHSLVRAVLPAWHPVAFKISQAASETTDYREAPDQMVREAIAAFDAMSEAEKMQIFNGWHVPAERPPSSAMENDPIDFITFRVLVVAIGDKPGAHWEYRNDDMAGIEPVRLLVTEGTSKATALDALERLTRLIDEAWDDLVSYPSEGMQIAAVTGHFAGESQETFRGETRGQTLEAFNKKGGSSQMPVVPQLGSTRNDKAARAMPAA